MNIAEDTRKANLEGIAGHEALVLHSIGVGRFHEIVGEFTQESRQHAELVAMLSRLHLDTCSQRCNLQIRWKTADHSSDLLDQVRENAMQRPCEVPMCDVEVAVDISLHALVPIRVEHVLRRQLAALPGDLAEDATRTGRHCARMIIHKLLIHGALVGFQLGFLRHRLVILPLGGFDHLLPEVFVVQALLRVLGLFRLEVLELGLGRLRRPLGRLQQLQLCRQTARPGAHVRHTFRFEFPVEVRDIGHLELLQDGTDRILSADLLGTGVADAPAPVLLERQGLTARRSVLIPVASRCQVAELGAEEAFRTVKPTLDGGAGFHDHRGTTGFGTGVLGPGPTTSFRELEMEAAQQGILATVHLQHPDSSQPVVSYVVKLRDFHLCTEVFVPDAQSSNAAALEHVLVGAGLEFETCECFTRRTQNRVVGQQGVPVGPIPIGLVVDDPRRHESSEADHWREVTFRDLPVGAAPALAREDLLKR
mmetsp:Transcript_8997/g.15329  ORF Transcript_8997/g.15329 Transcript_8997/m.15329 type:complete len:479 (+) Transcript_8997:1164-2600(+)